MAFEPDFPRREAPTVPRKACSGGMLAANLRGVTAS